jgi:hypothetical protein
VVCVCGVCVCGVCVWCVCGVCVCTHGVEGCYLLSVAGVGSVDEEWWFVIDHQGSGAG